MKNLFEDLKAIDFLAVLPNTTREAAVNVYETNGNLFIFAAQAMEQTSANLASKGGTGWDRPIFGKLLAEIHTLLCSDDTTYDKVRTKLSSHGKMAAEVVVVLVAHGLANKFGIAFALIVPFVATIFAGIANAGLEAWCKQFTADQLEAAAAALAVPQPAKVEREAVPTHLIKASDSEKVEDPTGAN